MAKKLIENSSEGIQIIEMLAEEISSEAAQSRKEMLSYPTILYNNLENKMAGVVNRNKNLI